MRLSRGLIITAAAVVGVAVIAIAVGSLWLNSFIHSAGFKDEVQARAAQTLGAPVEIEAVDFDIFNGIKLRAVTTQLDPSHAGGQGALKIQVEQVNCTYSLWDLLVLKLHLTGVVLDKPQIVLTKQPTAPLTSLPQPPAAPPEPTAVSSGKATVTGQSVPFQFVLDRAKVKDGSLTLKNASGTTTVELLGVNASASTSGYYLGRDTSGKIRIAQTTASGMVLKNFYTPFVYRPNYLMAKPFEATAFNGRIAGAFLMDGTQPSTLDVNANGVDLAQVTEATKSNSSAHLTGTLDLQSKWRGVETGEITGEGDAQVANGHLEGVHMLEEAASLLRVKELHDPAITKAQTHFVVANRQTNFNGLEVESPLFKITGHGTVGFDGGLNADLVLVLTRNAMGKLPRPVASSFVQQADGTGSIAFHVTGTTSNPQTDLVSRLLLQNVQIKKVITNALDKFFK